MCRENNERANKMKTQRNGALVQQRDDDGSIIEATSYDTCIVAIATSKEKSEYIFNATKYSSTTSRHQANVFSRIDSTLMTGRINGLVKLTDVPRGTTASGLRALARKII